MVLLQSGLLALLSATLFSGFVWAESTKIDLQWALCDRDHETVLRKLGVAGKKPFKAFNITYYDTATPVYLPLGLGFRVKVKHDQTLSMIKARFEEERSDVPDEADCVWDRYGDSVFYTCAVKSPLDDDQQDMWSAEQVAFVERYQNVTWAGLVPYGPFLDPKWKVKMDGIKAKFDDVIVEMPELPAPLHLMEIEVPAQKSQGVEVYQKVTEYLTARDVVLCERQDSKTKRLFDALAEHRSIVTSHGGQAVLEEGRTDSAEWEL